MLYHPLPQKFIFRYVHSSTDIKNYFIYLCPPSFHNEFERMYKITTGFLPQPLVGGRRMELNVFYLLGFFETGSHYATQADLKLKSLLS
jgi:hypothetical protein